MSIRVIPPTRFDRLLDDTNTSLRYIKFFEEIGEKIDEDGVSIESLQNQVTINQGNISTNAGNIAAANVAIATNTGNITILGDDIGDLQAALVVTVKTANFTTTGPGRILCDGAITITLNDTPEDGEAVYIKRLNLVVTIDGNGKTIDDAATQTIDVLYDTYLVIYSAYMGAWYIM